MKKMDYYLGQEVEVSDDKLPDGTKYDEEKERFDLIPPEPLIELAKVYTYGAKKYTQTFNYKAEELACYIIKGLASQNVDTQIERFMQRECVEDVTKNIYEKSILSGVSTYENGTETIASSMLKGLKNENFKGKEIHTKESVIKRLKELACSEREGSQTIRPVFYCHGRKISVPFVEDHLMGVGCILITTIKSEMHVDIYVVGATTDLACLATLLRVLKELFNIFDNIQQGDLSNGRIEIVIPGARNMEKGMAWGRVFGAIMRHLWKFWCGEDRDPESGLHHVAQAAWGCFTLLDYTKNHPKFDDRVKPVLDKDQVEFEKTCKDIQDNAF